MRRCPECGIDQPTIYLHHGKLYCGACLPDHPADDVLIRSRLMQIKSRALQAQARALRTKEGV
jgi:hypothetical protein